MESGSRVTLVYSLTLTERPREDPAWNARYAGVQAAIANLAATKAGFPEGGTLMIACTRQVVTGATQPPIDALRGTDRAIAELLIAAGFEVSVRTCVAATPNETSPAPRFPSELYDIARLAKELTPKVVATFGDVMTFSETAEGDEGEDLGATSLAEYILDDVPYNSWIIRDNAAATLIHEALFSADGYFGNEHYDAYIYTLAALEVRLRDYSNQSYG